MTNVRRHRSVIIAAITLAVLVCTAFFPVSYAKWLDSLSATAAASGAVGQYYVDYSLAAARESSEYIIKDGYYADPKIVGAQNGIGHKAIAARRVKATTVRDETDATTFRYHNYVCVKRMQNGVLTDGAGAPILGDDGAALKISGNTLAFVDYSVLDDDGNMLGDAGYGAVKVKSFKVTRVDTSDTGAPTGADAALSPKIYNSPDGKGLYTINRVEVEGSVSAGQNAKYYMGGTYHPLFFGAGKEQYYALDIIIETDAEAEFTLVAEVSNWDYRNRYEQGYGQPYGFYLGATINGVPAWEPRQTTKMNGTVIDKDSTDNLTELGVGYAGDTNKFKRPNYVDLAISINLTESSEAKLYMIGDDGQREKFKSDENGYFVDAGGNKINGSVDNFKNKRVVDDVTVYFMPKKITLVTPGNAPVSASSKGIDITNELNLKIPQGMGGEYTFHYMGKVTYSYEDGGVYITQKPDAAGKYTVSGSSSNSYRVPDYNCYIEELVITYKKQNQETNYHAVTFVNPDIEGGAIADAFIEHGQKIAEDELVISNNGYAIDGYFTDKECTAEYNIDTPVTHDITLYVKWKRDIVSTDYYVVGLNGKWGSGAIQGDYRLGPNSGSVTVTVAANATFKIAKPNGNTDAPYWGTYGTDNFGASSLRYSEYYAEGSGENVKIKTAGEYIIRFENKEIYVCRSDAFTANKNFGFKFYGTTTDVKVALLSGSTSSVFAYMWYNENTATAPTEVKPLGAWSSAENSTGQFKYGTVFTQKIIGGTNLIIHDSSTQSAEASLIPSGDDIPRVYKKGDYYLLVQGAILADSNPFIVKYSTGGCAYLWATYSSGGAVAAWVWSGSANYSGGTWPGITVTDTYGSSKGGTTTANAPNTVSIIINNNNRGSETATLTLTKSSGTTINPYTKNNSKSGGSGSFTIKVIGAEIT